jgi:hypothetical protein
MALVMDERRREGRSNLVGHFANRPFDRAQLPKFRARVARFVLHASLASSPFVGCTKADPAATEAAEKERDRGVLQGIAAHDERVSQAMRDADAASQKGDKTAALQIVMTRANPAVDDGLRAAEAGKLGTAWGKTRRDELAAVLKDRKAAMPKYVDAISGADPEKLLAALQAQAAIEKKAEAATKAVKEP